MEECGERLGFTYKLGYNNQHGYMLSRREEKFGQSCFEKVYGDWSRNCLCVKKLTSLFLCFWDSDPDKSKTFHKSGIYNRGQLKQVVYRLGQCLVDDSYNF
ncbi:uncharacterized protein LOC142814042 [Rhipicephalus microplus]|uniref:uncharacterized protein LOC142814042 n=1 Tax=Rhipicephalus microplus TaxID=6941 RepID=UPI003F6B2865